MSSLADGLQKSFDPSFGNYLIHGIEEVYLPASIAWWPHTLGWKVLLVCLVCWLGLVVIRAYGKWQGNRYRRQALLQLAAIRQSQASFKQHPDGSAQYKLAKQNALKQLPALLKLTALHAYPRNEVAQLSGEVWLRYLNECCASPCFDSSSGALLLAIDYQAATKWQADHAQTDALFSACQQWLQQHRTPSGQTVVKRQQRV